MTYRVVLYVDTLLQLCTEPIRPDYYVFWQSVDLEFFTTPAIVKQFLISANGKNVKNKKRKERLVNFILGKSLYPDFPPKRIRPLFGASLYNDAEATIGMALAQGITHILVNNSTLDSPFRLYFNTIQQTSTGMSVKICQLEDLYAEINKGKAIVPLKKQTQTTIQRHRKKPKHPRSK